MVRTFRDMARCIDYIETRPAEFRADKLAYYGLSSGAERAALFGALEPRFKAVIGIGGGINTTRNQPGPYQPEMDIFNFYPRVKTPFLLLNGRYDFGNRWETELDYFWELLGTPKDDKVFNFYSVGHIAYDPKAFKDTLVFLNKYLGPVE